MKLTIIDKYAGTQLARGTLHITRSGISFPRGLITKEPMYIQYAYNEQGNLFFRILDTEEDNCFRVTQYRTRIPLFIHKKVQTGEYRYEEAEEGWYKTECSINFNEQKK